MMRFEQPVGNMDWEIGGRSRSVASKAHGGSSLTEGHSRHWLPKLLVRIHDDVSGIWQPRVRQMGGHAPSQMRAEFETGDAYSKPLRSRYTSVSFYPSRTMS